MSLCLYLILMSIGTLLCWVAWGFVLFSTDPNQASWATFLFFYLSLFMAIVGSFSTLGFVIRRRIIKNDEVVFRHVDKTFRQSIIIAFLIILALVLRSQDLLRWWNAVILLLLFFGLEGIIFSGRKYKNLDYVK